MNKGNTYNKGQQACMLQGHEDRKGTGRIFYGNPIKKSRSGGVYGEFHLPAPPRRYYSGKGHPP